MSAGLAMSARAGLSLDQYNNGGLMFMRKRGEAHSFKHSYECNSNFQKDKYMKVSVAFFSLSIVLKETCFIFSIR